ncbi:type I polyketide synthase [Tautonia sociabilis]|uniref:SDR family NAD(P)-dependent oxidoreductase n=1 Tax=Tautonia sociabilis TaxID=2080755 RepID=A0A432MJR0_9BACT|nr:type I polyketide synthase [Tautonia sociabilis]RUL87437.1 SDR family NAD(P)-dependent oxidoreductase [Tautonia sociabilis]
MNICVPRVLVVAPGGGEGAGLIAAAGRAGALGMLDLSSIGGEAARRASARLASQADRPFGAVMASDRIDDGPWPDRLAVVACRGDRRTDWAAAIGRIRRRGRIALAEVPDRWSAAAAREAGADGVIVSGLEAGGPCGDESSFVLLQGVLADAPGGPPVWVRGGIGPHSAAACVATGASGVVLDGAVLLARELPLPAGDRDRLTRLDGGETSAIGPQEGPSIRVDVLPGSTAIARLREAAELGGAAWTRAVAELVGWGAGQARPIGQDAAFAATMARRFVTVGGIVRAVEEAIDRGRSLAIATQPLAPGSPMARSLGTRYPVVQGPMTRVSDSAAFASAVADGGALPMLALAMLRGPEAAALLSETASRLGDLPWGVGVLGFVDPSLRAEQLEAIRAVRPPFALIAGGRPDQAETLEQIGIRTFLHAPSPGLLGRYLRDGARRFVLEGRECGGHVGPRSSLVLWEQAVSTVLEAIDGGTVAEPAEIHLLFAGGVHDARSASAVAALASPLADLGVKVGVLVGTAYLFTREAVDCGAIAPRFQAEALRCRETVLLPTGPGHEVRAVPSPFTEQFAAERRRLLQAGASAEAIREELERLNVGRLRAASKGVDRVGGAGSPLVSLGEAEQYERGLYMIGQVAALRDRITTIAELHAELSEGASARLERTEGTAVAPASSPSDVAIVGMSAIFPGAGDLRSFWGNTLKGVDAIVEIPPDRWDWRPYYDPDPRAPDKVVSRWGGFLPDVPFDPIRYGMPPSSLPSIEPAQLLVLEAVRAALDDAGYADRPFPRERTAVVLGMGGGAAQVAMGYAFRSYLPMLESVAPEAAREAIDRAFPLLPEWTEDSFPGFLLNVTAGRVANRFDLGGANYTVDAACGSSLAAASLAVRELETGAADMVILGGADTVQNPFTYLAFSKTHAFSPRGRCRPFDASADGIVISEGVGVVVLKRLADAERDGDRIYAVIKGIGSSSDGRARGLTAPNGEGQRLALARAYAKAGVRPSAVGYFEAHGTGTAVGDVVEVNALAQSLREDGAPPASAVVGSVKSMIGHTKCAAGLAGLINASLALYHRVLPPTIGVDEVNPKADLHDGPLRVNTRARPWLSPGDAPRLAGVSAFGFGGTNFHAVLESYEADPAPRPDPMDDWPAELFVWRSVDRSALIDRIDRLRTALDAGASPRLLDLSHALLDRVDPEADDAPTLAIVASSLDDLRGKLGSARERIARGDRSIDDPIGVHFADRPSFARDRVAVLFPGQGAQRLEMLGDLALAFEEVRLGFEAFDAALLEDGRPAIGPRVFPPTTLDDASRERARLALSETTAAQPAVGAASVGMLRLLSALGIEPGAAGGHSFGELVALHAAGAMDVGALARLSEARGRVMAEAAGPEPGAMAALLCDADRASSLIADLDGVVLANRNGPRQSVIAGSRDALNRAIDRARGAGVRCVDLPVGAAFHSPIVASAAGPMARLASEAIAFPPALPVFSNLDAAPHPADPAEIARRLGDHLAAPVRFDEMIEAMYASGVRVFIECGPGVTLSALVRSILADRPHLAASCDAPGRPGIPTLLSAVARLLVAGVAVTRPSRLTGRRGPRPIDLDRLPLGAPEYSPSTWLVNGSRARPIGGPEPARLGMAPELLGLPDRSSPAACPSVEQGRPGSNGGRFASAGGEADAPPAPHPAVANGHADGARNGHPPREPSRLATSSLPDSTRSPRANPSRIEPMSPRPGTEPGARNGHASALDRLRSQAFRDDAPTDDVARAFQSFQETMRSFLEVQKATMIAYLSGRPPAEPSEGARRSRIELDGNDVLDRFDRFDGGEVSPEAPPPGPVDLPLQESDERPKDRLRAGGSAPVPAEPVPTPTPTPAPAPSAGDREARTPRERPENRRPGPAGSNGQGSSSGVPIDSSLPTAESASPGASVSEVLLRIVRDRTGYPIEMLGMGLDLEADLGIDSIKRVEILGTLRDSVDGLGARSGSSLMDSLSRAKTLGEIVARVESALSAGGGAESGRPARGTAGRAEQERGAERLAPNGSSVGGGEHPDREGEAGSAGVDPIGDAQRPGPDRRPPAASPARLRRLVLEPIPADPPSIRSGLASGGAVLVTEDGRGVFRRLANALRAGGHPVEVVDPGWADLDSPSSISDRLDRVRASAPISGIIHVQPLGDAEPARIAPAARPGEALRRLFLLARASADDLERSSRCGGSCLIAATAMGGAFASVDSIGAPVVPAHGGVAGLVKTLAREWPAVRSRVVDLDPREPAEVLADRLAAEAFLDDRWAEVGYLAGRRIRLRAVERALDRRHSCIEIGEGDPILITGGARGISAAVARELARRWRPRLLLVGSSPVPEGEEDPETAGLVSAADLKKALHRRLARGGRHVSPADLQEAYLALVRSREIRSSLQAIRDAGAEAHYARADVRAPATLQAVISGWRERFGEPVGLIHGAGVIHDKLLREKSPESFDRVFGTKVGGAMNVIRSLRGDALKFAAFFSSIAGRFGNEGQSDYAAANDALNKLALWLDRRWPGRVLSANWGPWSGIGMVSDLEGHLGRRGLGMIDPPSGCSALLDELEYGRKGEVEVILSGDLGTLDGPLPAAGPIAEESPQGVAR